MTIAMLGKSVEKDFFLAIKEIDINNHYQSETINSIGRASFGEFKKRYPEYIQLLTKDITNGVAHTFNHPTNKILNEIYKIIWEKELGLHPDDFINLQEDPLKGIELPIPSFVSRSILSDSDNMPWGMEHSSDKSCIHQDIDNYISLTKKSIDFYNKQPWIAQTTADHKKIVSANSFLRELNII